MYLFPARNLNIYYIYWYNSVMMLKFIPFYSYVQWFEFLFQLLELHAVLHEFQVGPKQRSFNVKDKNEIEFKPQQMVSDITQIYLNLGENQAFCMAVSADGRSYSPELFQKTTNVLQKIGKPPTMINQVDSLRDKIEVIYAQKYFDIPFHNVPRGIHTGTDFKVNCLIIPLVIFKLVLSHDIRSKA